MSHWEPWWKCYPSWLKEELEAFQARGLNFSVDPAQQQLGRIVMNGRAPISSTKQADIIVVYPDTYPNTRPIIYMPEHNLAKHQNPIGGQLCLLPRASEHWRPSMKAAELVERIPALIKIVESGGPISGTEEDPQGEPFSEYYPYTQVGGVLVPAGALAISEDIKHGFFNLSLPDKTPWMNRVIQHRFRALLSHVMNHKKETIVKVEGDLASKFLGDTIRGQWVRLEKPIIWTDPKKFRKELADKVTNGKPNSPVDEFIAILFSEEVQQKTYQDAWVFSAASKITVPGNVKKQELDLLLRGMRYTEEDLASRIPELRPLRSKTVSLVGLGSLGAPLAHELARAQVKKLRILDPDHVDAGTGVRWLLGLDAAGLPKADFLKTFLERNYPFVGVESFSTRIGDAPVALQKDRLTENQTLQKLMEGTNLVVDATVEDNVSRVISQVASEMKIPQIYLWSIDGYGGVIARINPKKATGCFHCLGLFLENRTIEPPKNASNTEAMRVQPRGCGDPTFAAAAIDLMPIVSQAARLAFSTLCEDSGEGVYPKIEDDVFVLQLRAPDGSLITPCWRAYRLTKHPTCALCFPSL